MNPMITIEQLKEKIYGDKIKKILTSELEYSYRHNCEFILEQYQNICKKISQPQKALLMLPLIALEEFELPKNDSTQMQSVVDNFFKQNEKNTQINLINCQKNEDQAILSLIFFKYSKSEWTTIQEKLQLITLEQKENLLQTYLTDKNAKDELNFFQYTFQGNFDYLTIVQMQKSPMINFLIQKPSISNGYHTPDEIIDAGFQSEYIMVMKKSLKTYEEIKITFPQLADYLIPIAFLQKVLFTVHINQLKKFKSKIKSELFLEIKKIHPTICEIIGT